MSLLESYFLLFIDSLYAGLAINPKDEVIFYSMEIFGIHNKFLMFLVVIIASIFAIIFNYYFGRVICKILSNFENTQGAKSREKARLGVKEFFIKYHLLFLLLSVWPFAGKFVQLMAGIYKAPLRNTLLICIICKIMFYGYFFLT